MLNILESRTLALNISKSSMIKDMFCSAIEDNGHTCSAAILELFCILGYTLRFY